MRWRGITGKQSRASIAAEGESAHRGPSGIEDIGTLQHQPLAQVSPCHPENLLNPGFVVTLGLRRGVASPVAESPVGIDVEALYRRFGPMVLRRCRAMLNDEQLALDAMQDVFVQVLRRQEALDDRGCSSLLFRVATNVCLNRLRTQGRKPLEPATELLSRIAAAEEELERNQARSVLARIFSQEPESSATIAVLHLHDGMTLEETAEAVNMSVSGVRKRLRKLKAMLSELEAAR